MTWLHRVSRQKYLLYGCSAFYSSVLGEFFGIFSHLETTPFRKDFSICLTNGMRHGEIHIKVHKLCPPFIIKAHDLVNFKNEIHDESCTLAHT